ncbi:MAG: hypothetical protein V1872_02860, partial [bacterium]
KRVRQFREASLENSKRLLQRTKQKFCLLTPCKIILERCLIIITPPYSLLKGERKGDESNQ